MVVLKAEDLNTDLAGTMGHLTAFLQIDEFKAANRLQNQSHFGVQNKENSTQPMLKDTRKMLQNFFQPANLKLARFVHYKDEIWSYGDG